MGAARGSSWGSRTREALGVGRKGLTTLAERLIETAPRIPVRDLATLREQFPGLGPEEIADKLISGAVKSTATVGAGVGAAAMLPTPPAMAAELVTETFAVAVVEYKLIAELHEVYGLRAHGSVRQRATVYLAEWTQRRGIDVTKPSTLDLALGVRMKRELRQQLLKRTMRNLPTLTPFMVGAAIGAVMNRRDTHRLAERVRKDLREHLVPWDVLGPPDERPAIEP
ncbi:hypothetical protein [Streptomyces sp. NBC_01537]|uniref:hypothetical protein n=1 Tax=Streptomyces sp. NBC_01537 TaxID=2903896 RepID=UPI003868D310